MPTLCLTFSQWEFCCFCSGGWFEICLLFVESRDRDFSFSGSYSRWLHMLWLDKAKPRNFIWVPYVRYRPRYFDHPLLLSMHFAVELHQKCSSLDSKQQPYALLGSQVVIRPSVLQHQPSMHSKIYPNFILCNQNTCLWVFSDCLSDWHDRI